MKDRPATEQPHKGHVVGAGKHHKHSYYYPTESKEVRNERKRFTEMDLKEAVDKEVKAPVLGLVQNQLQETLSAIMPSLMESVKIWMVQRATRAVYHAKLCRKQLQQSGRQPYF